MDSETWRSLMDDPPASEPDWTQRRLASQRAEAVAAARQYDVRMVRFIYCDLAGIIRGKSVHLGSLEKRMSTGLGLPTALLGLNSLDQPRAIEVLGPPAELRLVPDPGTFVPFTFSPRNGGLLSDLRYLDGRPSPLCARNYLK